MFIKPERRHNFRGFELNKLAISYTSLDRSNIRLPYSGALPKDLGHVKSASLYFNVQPFQPIPVRVNLVVDYQNYIVECSKEEVMEILQAFFDYCAAGLEPYWSGHWYAHFMDWKASVDPSRMVGCLTKLPKEDRDKVFLLLKRYEDGETEASGEFDKKI